MVLCNRDHMRQCAFPLLRTGGTVDVGKGDRSGKHRIPSMDAAKPFVFCGNRLHRPHCRPPPLFDGNDQLAEPAQYVIQGASLLLDLDVGFNPDIWIGQAPLPILRGG